MAKSVDMYMFFSIKQCYYMSLNPNKMNANEMNPNERWAMLSEWDDWNTHFLLSQS